MSVHEAELGDVYVDAHGKLWRVMDICKEPTVTVVEIEPYDIQKPIHRNGGVSGLMWNGFKRIYRPENP